MRSALFITVIFLVACGGPKSSGSGSMPVSKDTITPEQLQFQPASAAETDSFTEFHNAEMVEYCVPLPRGWHEDYDAATVKAQHVFRKDKGSDYSITVQGLLRADTSVSLLRYFQNTYTEEDEASGKIIELKQLLDHKNCFYATGYWNNSYYKSRFIEVTWLRPEEAVIYKMELPAGDTAFWYRQLNWLVNYNTGCK